LSNQGDSGGATLLLVAIWLHLISLREGAGCGRPRALMSTWPRPCVLDSKVVTQPISGTSRVVLQTSPKGADPGSLLLSVEATGGSPVPEIAEIAIE
jgi:hypothetical protein